jgi:hypothetical protein
VRTGATIGLFSGTCILMRDQKTTGCVLARRDVVQQVPKRQRGTCILMRDQKNNASTKSHQYMYQEMFTTEDILTYGTEQYNTGFTTGFIIGLSIYSAVVLIFSL